MINLDTLTPQSIDETAFEKTLDLLINNVNNWFDMVFEPVIKENNVWFRCIDTVFLV